VDIFLSSLVNKNRKLLGIHTKWAQLWTPEN
jgi:hypothetical protein